MWMDKIMETEMVNLSQPLCKRSFPDPVSVSGNNAIMLIVVIVELYYKSYFDEIIQAKCINCNEWKILMTIPNICTTFISLSVW